MEKMSLSKEVASNPEKYYKCCAKPTRIESSMYRVVHRQKYLLQEPGVERLA